MAAPSAAAGTVADSVRDTVVVAGDGGGMGTGYGKDAEAMIEQASTWDPIREVTLLRWVVVSSAGRKVTWAADEQAAREKAERAGFVVESIRPSAGESLR